MTHSFSPTPLGGTAEAAVRNFFSSHPVFGRYLDRVCVALTGSFAYGLGGHGADVDILVVCNESDYETIRADLVLQGRIGPDDPPEEDLDGVVGDYALRSLESIWSAVKDYGDLDKVFVAGHLVHIMGRRDPIDEITGHCQNIPRAVLDGAVGRERASFSRDVYAFLRSFQNGDGVGRFLARAGMARSALRLAYLAEGQAPPYDKHLYALLPSLHGGAAIAALVKWFLHDTPPLGSDEEQLYRGVAAADDWRQMYREASGTPVLQFRDRLLGLLEAR